MKIALAAEVMFVMAAGMPVSAHRLDEYLEATAITLEKDRVQAEIRLAPGVAVLPIVLAAIDTNADGVISDAEQRAYANRVLRDLSLTIDGNPVMPRLISFQFPSIDEMQEGLGEIRLDLEAPVPITGPVRKLVFQNHHQSLIAAYLVNCLVPRDPDIRVTAQNRNYQQSFFELHYTQPGARSWSGESGLLWTIALLLFARLLLLWRGRRRWSADFHRQLMETK